MLLNRLLERRERYRQALPQPLYRVARAGWKVGIKPALKIVTVLLEKSKGFDFPKDDAGWDGDWKLYMLLGLYERDTVALCARVIRPGMTVLDIGAHIGYFTRLFASMVGMGGKVYAFEPHPENFLLLKSNTSRFSNVVLMDKGASDVNDSGCLFICNSKGYEESGRYSLFRQPDSIADASLTEIKLIALDTFWEELGRPRIDLIKMDIEGAEPKALKGAEQLIRHHKRIILVTEFHPANLRSGGTDPEEFLDFVSSLGFRWAVIGKGGNLVSELPRNGDSYVNLYCEKS
jgi:FkbM family methyltransferase